MKNAMLKVILGICMSAVLISGCGRSTGTQQNVVETGQEVQQDSELADDSSEHSNENTQDGGNGQEDVNGKEGNVYFLGDEKAMDALVKGEGLVPFKIMHKYNAAEGVKVSVYSCKLRLA